MNNTSVFIAILLGIGTTVICYLDSLIEKKQKNKSDYIKAFLTGSVISVLTIFLLHYLNLGSSSISNNIMQKGGSYTAPPPNILTGNPNF